MKTLPAVKAKRPYRKQRAVSFAKASRDLKLYRKWLVKLEREHKQEMRKAKRVLAKKVQVLVKSIMN